MGFFDWLKSLFGADNRPRPAGDGGLSKAVGQVLNKPAPAPAPVVVTKPSEPVRRFPLPFESKVQGSVKWSEHLRSLFRASKIPDLEFSDQDGVYPGYSKLSREARVEFWAHLFGITIKYECDYNPRSSSVDVGQKGDLDTYSVGLLQMSVVDQKNYRLDLGYDYEDLMDPFKNMILAVRIAEMLLVQDHKIMGRMGERWKGLSRYWGTMRDGKSSLTGILVYVRNLKFGGGDGVKPEAPKPSTPISGKRLGVVVGHEKDAPGARMCEPYRYYEYPFNTEVAHMMAEYGESKGLDVEIFLRDDIGISGAYRATRAAKCDVVIELHFNAADGRARGSEVLCSTEAQDKALAMLLEKAMCRVFERTGSGDRGLQLRDSGRGAESCTSFPGKANALVEPAFGDNPSDAKMLVERREQYAHALVDAVIDYLT